LLVEIDQEFNKVFFLAKLHIIGFKPTPKGRHARQKRKYFILPQPF
jgi:hypothetical protein